MRVEIEGGGINVAVHGPGLTGTGTAVMFLHGAGMDRSVWAMQAPLLGGKGVTALVPDLPGHGRSEGEPLPTVEALAGFVWRLADAMGLSRLSLVGHSMGALAALAAAAAQPSRVERLVLLGAALALPVNAALLDAARDAPGQAGALIAGWGLGRRGGLGGGGVPGASLDAGVRAMLAGSRPGVLHADLAVCNLYKDGAAAAARLRCPTLVLVGAEDRMAPPRRGRELGQAIADAAVEVIPQAGHMLMLEAPDPVARALLPFLLAPAQQRAEER